MIKIYTSSEHRLLRCDKAGWEQQRGHKGPGKVETYIKVKMTNKNNSIDEGSGGGGGLATGAKMETKK